MAGSSHLPVGAAGAFRAQWVVMGKLDHFNYYHYDPDKFVFVPKLLSRQAARPSECPWGPVAQVKSSALVWLKYGELLTK